MKRSRVTWIIVGILLLSVFFVFSSSNSVKGVIVGGFGYFESLRVNNDFILDSVAIKNNSQAMSNSLDINGFTGGIVMNSLLYSSVKANFTHSDMFTIFGDTNNMFNSTIHFLDLTRLGNNESNIVEAIHLHGDFDNIIRTDSNQFINSSFYNDIDITINVTGKGEPVEVFVLDNDVLYIGSDINFTVIGFSLSAVANQGILAIYYYCNNESNWVVATGVTDTTVGFTQSGKIVASNPSDRGVCNKDIFGVPFSNPNNFTYIAIQRTRNNLITFPVINEISISGGVVDFILNSDFIKLNGVVEPPKVCDILLDGAIYYDTDISKHCACDSVDWVQMNDYVTVCS